MLCCAIGIQLRAPFTVERRWRAACSTRPAVCHGVKGSVSLLSPLVHVTKVVVDITTAGSARLPTATGYRAPEADFMAPNAEGASSSDECFHGQYVLADRAAPPPYQLPQARRSIPDITSPYLSRRCAGNEDWADWRWVPSSSQCAAKLRGRAYYDVCARLRGRRIFYVGDSTQFEMFVSMGMLMGGQSSMCPRGLSWTRGHSLPMCHRLHSRYSRLLVLL